jgi:hypothetical protein
MSENSVDAIAEVEVRLRRDGVTVDDEERTRLIDLVPLAHDWMRQLTFAETRYAEPALTHPPK